MTVLEARSLSKTFTRDGLWRKGQAKRAVNGVSFTLAKGKTLAVVGESGSGKSTLARLLMRLLVADEGDVLLHGESITSLRGAALRRKRRHIQMVFQDPFASLNPRMTIGNTVAEGLRVHQAQLNRAQRNEKVAEVLQQCGMDADAMPRYPHQFSGGQRQRIGIARALVVQPDVLVLDEPVSALDVSVQAQILNLLRQLQQDHGLAYVFISHDLSVVRHIADDMLVMFAGHVLETGSAKNVLLNPKHPYTTALLDAMPIAHPSLRDNSADEIAVDPEQTADHGCPFRLRCDTAEGDCAHADMHLNNAGHACLHPIVSPL
ncbi:MAG: ATP-binding cassette domain-containing protein [Mariprofundaceae bacterium]|nr:ATP-binding cassette domain-containing protein [Mariprofundaceae bacterium]